MQEELNILIQAQYPLIYLVTAEEDRAEKEIATISQMKQQPRKLYVWTLTHGMVEYGQARTTQHNTISPEAAIEWTTRQKEPAIFIFKDLHPFKDSAAVTRWLRDAIASFQGTESNYSDVTRPANPDRVRKRSSRDRLRSA
jgi:hypothetical protein